jgi:hypothetical protein
LVSVESTPVSNFANVTTNVNDEDLNKAIEIYQNGFTSPINQDMTSMNSIKLSSVVVLYNSIYIQWLH